MLFRITRIPLNLYFNTSAPLKYLFSLWIIWILGIIYVYCIRCPPKIYTTEPRATMWWRNLHLVSCLMTMALRKFSFGSEMCQTVATLLPNYNVFSITVLCWCVIWFSQWVYWCKFSTYIIMTSKSCFAPDLQRLYSLIWLDRVKILPAFRVAPPLLIS